MTEATREEFDSWFREYPKKTNPSAAGAAYRFARRNANAAELLTAARNYAESRMGEDPKFTKEARNFLVDDYWRGFLVDEVAGGVDYLIAKGRWSELVRQARMLQPEFPSLPDDYDTSQDYLEAKRVWLQKWAVDNRDTFIERIRRSR